MLIGVPKEIEGDEYRVALPPPGAEVLTQAGHELFVEKGGGLGSGFTDDFYVNAGACGLECHDTDDFLT
jgi:alanine dehydrogenase